MIRTLRRPFSAWVFLAVGACAVPSAFAVGWPAQLRVEGAAHPLGVDADSPRFSWQTQAPPGARDVEQVAYRIQVRSAGGDVLWDTGRVHDGHSIGIAYSGRTLSPETRYPWTVTAWYADHTQRSSASWFETGLRDPAAEAWQGAEWIGGTSEDRVLYAPYLPLYDLGFGIAIAEGSRRAAVVFAANDPRLLDRNRNPFQVASSRDQSYFKVEFDIGPLAADGDGHAVLNVYRAGYARGDDPGRAVRSLRIRRKLVDDRNAHARHEVRVHVEYGELSFAIDGEEDPFEPVSPTAVAPASPGASERVSLNRARPEGTPAHDVITFGELNELGFALEPGQRARVWDLRVSDIHPPRNPLFSEPQAAAPYHGIFAARASAQGGGLKVEGGAFDLDGGDHGLFVVADPSRNAQPMLRATFEVRPARVAAARLYLTARGIYQAFLNGQRVGDDEYSPGLSQYNRTHYYQVHDVTGLLKAGRNAIGALLGEGWWSGLLSFGNNWNFFGDRQSLLARLVVTYADGTRQVVTTNDRQWKVWSQGPTVYASLDLGEVHDATREGAVAGWSTAAYDDRAWHGAVVVPLEGSAFLGTIASPFGPATSMDYGHLRLTGQVDEPARIYRRIGARSVHQVRPGVFVYDLGQNIVGVPRIALRGLRAGQRIVVRYAETLYPDLPASGDNVGMIMTENYRAAISTDQYIARAGDQVFEPRFTSHGFQYLEISGLDDALPLPAVQGVAISSVQALASDFGSSSPMLDRLWANLTWSNIDNFLTIPTDCPQRNERMGWSGDINVFSRTATYLSDAQLFLERHLQALRDAQRSDGRFSDIAPVGGGFGGVLWGSAGIVVPWELYQQYGDLAALRAQFPAMKAYADYLQGALDADSGLSRDAQLGDWLGPQNQQLGQAFLATTYQAYDLRIVSETARLLNEAADAQRYARLYEERRAYFQAHFLDEQAMTLGFVTVHPIAFGPTALEGKYQLADTQTSYAVALALGLVDDGRIVAARRHLAESVTRANVDDTGVLRPAYSLMTGFIGTAWISAALSEAGRTDLAYRQLLATQYPSWLYPVTQGATSIWERLNGYTREDGFGGNNSMNSFNHYSFGAVGQWLIGHALGIQRGEPGFHEFVLTPEPDPTGGLAEAHGHYDSPYGRIESAWQHVAGGIEYRFLVPANTRALLRLPALAVGELVEWPDRKESLRAEATSPEAGAGPTYRLPSGSYHVLVVDATRLLLGTQPGATP